MVKKIKNIIPVYPGLSRLWVTLGHFRMEPTLDSGGLGASICRTVSESGLRMGCQVVLGILIGD